MLLSRFWYLVLATVAVLGLAAGFLAQGIINRDRTAVVDDALRRDRFEIESLLRLDARTRLDNIAAIAADGKIRELLREAKTPKGRNAMGSKLDDRLRNLNRQLGELKGDLVFMLDQGGVIRGQFGGRSRKGRGMQGVPLVTRALAGYMRDDVWYYDGGVFRMAARPVVDGGRYVGALVHGLRMDAQLANKLSDRLEGATVAFFRGEDMIASHAPSDLAAAPTQIELLTALPAALKSERVWNGERSEVFDLEGRGRAVFSLAAGMGAEASVGYAIARPLERLASPMALFEAATSDDVEALPRATLVLGGMLAFALGMAMLYIEKDQLASRLSAALERIASGGANEVDVTTLRGAFRRMGEHANAALQRAAVNAAEMKQRAPRDLGEVLGPETENTGSAYFSFGERPSSPEQGDMLAPLPQDPAPATEPAPPNHAPGASDAAKRQDAAEPAPTQPMDSAGPGPSATPLDDLEDLEDLDPRQAYFRDVFDEYLNLKEKCGESVTNVTFDKFRKTLQKNHEQILKKHGASDVRFSVFVKNGKATLKATPVRA